MVFCLEVSYFSIYFYSMAKGGRPTSWAYEANQDTYKEICDRISNGEHIMRILEEKQYPSWPTFSRHLREDDEFYTLYMRAKENKSEKCIDNIITTLDDVKTGKIDSSTARVVIDAEKWLASKFNRKQYGDKQEIDHTNNGESFDPPTINFK